MRVRWSLMEVQSWPYRASQQAPAVKEVIRAVLARERMSIHGNRTEALSKKYKYRGFPRPNFCTICGPTCPIYPRGFVSNAHLFDGTSVLTGRLLT
jgi:hypothetical protein